MAWNTGYHERAGRGRSHVIEALTERASGDYLAYLQKQGMSYLIAGKEQIDCALLLHKLKALFGVERAFVAGVIPEELEYLPDGYTRPAEHPGRLERLEYETWESFAYKERSQRLSKTAWVYLPYGYDRSKQYNILYLSHGGWGDETTLMGTSESPHEFKHIIDHAIEDGKIQPLIIVLPTYNNTSGSDSGDYSLALQLVDNFHNELVNDLIPAAEGRYSTYAETTDPAGLAAWPVNGFVTGNDFTGKTVIPFCTSTSSGLGESGDLLAGMAEGGDWQEGRRFSSSASAGEITEWLDGSEL